MTAVTLMMGRYILEVAAEETRSSDQFEVSYGLSENVVSGSRVVMASVPLVMGTNVVAVSAASARSSVLGRRWWSWRIFFV